MQWLRRSLPVAWRAGEERFSIEPFFGYSGCVLHVDGAAHDCIGVWLPNNTAVSDLTVVPHHRLLRTSSPSQITRFAALVNISSPTLSSHNAGATIADAIAAGASAVLVMNLVAESPRELPVAINAPPPYGTSPWPVPVALVSPQTHDAVLSRPAARISHLQVRGTYDTADATSLYATLRVGDPPPEQPPEPPPEPPPDAAAPPVRLIISTPASGWFSCGGERGPGIALLLMLARRLPDLIARLRRDETVRRRSHLDVRSAGSVGLAGSVGSVGLAGSVRSVEVLLLATTLHELGHQGARRGLALAPEQGFTPETTSAWLALGASIIAHAGKEKAAGGDGPPPTRPDAFLAKLDYSDARLGPALAAYASVGFSPALNPSDRRGELVDIVGHGYRAFGFYGEHELFHTRMDSANATSPQLLESAARPTLQAVATLIAEELARSLPGKGQEPDHDLAISKASLLDPSLIILLVALILALTAALAVARHTRTGTGGGVHQHRRGVCLSLL